MKIKDCELVNFINKEHLSEKENYHARYIQKTSEISCLVLDNFFREEYASILASKFENLDFKKDNRGLLYDSSAVQITSNTVDADSKLFFSNEWQEYVSYLINCKPKTKDQVFKYRHHSINSKGFWIHTDIEIGSPKSMVVLGYFNKNWKPDHGGVLQMWNASHLNSKDVQYRWGDYIDRNLSFLESSNKITIEASVPGGLIPFEMTKEIEVAPLYNRVVIINFQNNLAFHSITPNTQERSSFLQWLY